MPKGRGGREYITNIVSFYRYLSYLPPPPAGTPPPKRRRNYAVGSLSPLKLQYSFRVPHAVATTVTGVEERAGEQIVVSVAEVLLQREVL